MVLKYYLSFWRWSVIQKENFWSQTFSKSRNQFKKKYTTILDILKVLKKLMAQKGKLNIVDSCFQNADKAIAIILQKEGGKIEKVSQKPQSARKQDSQWSELHWDKERRCNCHRYANDFRSRCHLSCRNKSRKSGSYHCR